MAYIAPFYTKEEIAAIEAACREYEETTNDLLYK